MARTATITDERLLEAARAEFLEHGIRATSAAIARRAGVSSGILFHRFGSKEALFAAAMKVGTEGDQREIPFDLRARVGKGAVKDTLVDIGELLLDRFFVVVPAQLMAWANPNPNPDPAPERGTTMAEGYRDKGIRGQQILVEYLRAEARLKRVRLVDPFVVAQTFGGALWFFAFEQVSGAKLRGTERTPSRKEFVRQLVDTLWSGLQP
jgi:AcrR family transcriptional regulator